MIFIPAEFLCKNYGVKKHFVYLNANDLHTPLTPSDIQAMVFNKALDQIKVRHMTPNAEKCDHACVIRFDSLFII